MHPVVSVIMPVRNAGRYLAAAVASIQAQSLRAFELVAIDDGSSDDSAALLAACAERDARIRLICQQQLGIVAALNRGIAEARGDFLARMDSDDVARPDRLARQMSFLVSHPQIAAVGSAYEVIDADGRHLKTIVPPTDPDQIAVTLMRTNCVAHPTAMIRRATLDARGPYRAAYRLAEDYDLWLRLAETHGLANLPVVTVAYRRSFSVPRIPDLIQQSLSALAARAAARLRACGAPDPTGGWPMVTREAAATLGISDADIAREVRRNALALARQARGQGAGEIAGRYVAMAHDHAPRREGAAAWLSYHWQQAKVWL